MAQVTIFPSVDAFNNNQSGFYDSEDFISAKTSSSSNALENDALWKFTTVGVGIGAGDTLNSVNFWAYESLAYDPAGVGGLQVYGDVNNLWSTLGPEDPPITSISFGTVSEGPLGVGVGWQSRSLSVSGGNSIPKAGEFNIGISADASDSFPIEYWFDSIESTAARSPYPAGTGQTDGRAFIVIDYTPAVTLGASPVQLMYGG